MRFAELVDFLIEVEQTPSRNKMVEILADVFKQAEPGEIDKIVYLSQGRVAPSYEKVEFGVGDSLTAEAIALATNLSKQQIQRLFSEQGDYGSVVEGLLQPDGSEHTVTYVFEQLQELAFRSGSGTVASKVTILVNLLGGMGKREGRFLVRIPLGRLRLGVGDPTVMDALSFARVGNKSLRKELERAYNICSDLGQVARLFWSGGVAALGSLHVQVGKPVRPALAERSKGPDDILARLGRCAAEPKLDGFRCQVHKNGEIVKVFSRNLEDFSDMFPELLQATCEQVQLRQAIFEGEAIAYEPSTGDYLPFQVTVQRRRKYGIDELKDKVPLRLVVFDMLYADGQDLTGETYAERRNRLLEAIPEAGTLEVTENLITEDAGDLALFFADKIQRGLEGIVCKRLESTYQAGSRNFNWIKLKRSYQAHLSDTIDTVIIGYWRGRGARAQFGIGSLLTAVYDPHSQRFATIARLGTGFSELEWNSLKGMLDEIALPHKPEQVDSLTEPDVWVTPKYVLAIQADEITRSPVHTCGLKLPAADEPPNEWPTNGDPRMGARSLGYALRFPRAVDFLRTDKNAEDATTVDEIINMYSLQGHQTTSD
ncbi:MAG: ATP-dependent DNA ligase [Chloroflexota bacterium]|nr:MAG: ATP-dependent DNA ligase [Chloroflexota bacterium]